MAEEPLQSTRWLERDPPDKRRPHATPADTDGALNWDKATRLAWRPAWAIRSRRGSIRPFLSLLRQIWRR